MTPENAVRCRRPFRAPEMRPPSPLSPARRGERPRRLLSRCLALLLSFGLTATPSATTAADAPLPPPAVFGVSLGDQAAATRARLRAAGYVSRAMTNRDGCVAELFEHASEDAPMPRARVWFCGPERRVARLDVEGKAEERFYKAVKDRFQLGIRQREGDPVGPRHADYSRKLAGGARMSMTNTRGAARLRLEDPEALRRADARYREDVRRLEETAAAREQARREQRDSHF